jgi:hypothetical protein
MFLPFPVLVLCAVLTEVALIPEGIAFAQGELITVQVLD